MAIFDHDYFTEVAYLTNKYARKHHPHWLRLEWYDTNKDELMTFFACLYGLGLTKTPGYSYFSKYYLYCVI